MDWKRQTKPLLEQIRKMIKQSDYSQRRVEVLAGFSKGYLSQLLAQNLDLKVWHILAILDVFDTHPGDFFERIYPRAEDSSAHELIVDPKADHDLVSSMAQLYRIGSSSFAEMRRRLERCEHALAQLEQQGIVQPQLESGGLPTPSGQ